MSNAIATFNKLAPRLMDDLISWFGFQVFQAAAVTGNGGHESGGFASMQEIHPVVRGSAGGYGMFQWTGPRRVNYFAFCKKHGYDVDSYEGNSEFLKFELSTSYKGAVIAVKAANDLVAAVKAFEAHFEYAGVKNYPSRTTWAKRALAAWEATHGKPVALISQPDDPGAGANEPAPKSMVTSKIGNTSIGVGLAGATDVGSQVNDAVSQAASLKDGAAQLGLFDVLHILIHRPEFWLGVAIMLAGAAIWYWRRQHRIAGV